MKIHAALLLLVLGAACTPTSSSSSSIGVHAPSATKAETVAHAQVREHTAKPEGTHDLGPTDETLAPLLRASTSIAPLLDTAPQMRLQVLISAVEASSPGKSPALSRMGYRVDAEYFYPASAVKLCTAVAALEKLAQLRHDKKVPSLGVETPLRVIAGAGAPPEERDASNVASGRITLGHEIRKSLVVSNNESFNRLFDFVGYDEIHQRLFHDGFDSVRLRHYVGWIGGDPKRSSRMLFLPPGKPALEVPPRTAQVTLSPSAVSGTLVGDAHLDAKGRLVDEPMVFDEKNRVSLRDLQDMLMSVVRPELIPHRKLQLEPPEREFLVTTLGTLPSESKNPVYSAVTQPDQIQKPMALAVRKALPSHRIRAYGKDGQAYGFVVINGYFSDETTGRAVFVAATLHVNGNGTMNDDQYEYGEVAAPFVQALGELVAKQYLDPSP